jgi:hypothetical protein
VAEPAGPVLTAVPVAALSVTGGSGARTEQQPSSEEIRQAREKAAESQAEADAVADDLDQAEAVLRNAAARAGLALEEYRSASLTAQEAQLKSLAARDALDEADAAYRESQARLTRWTHDAYATGLSVGDHPVAITLLSDGSTADLDLTVVTMQRVGRDWDNALAQMVRTRQDRQEAADTAQASADAAVFAAAEADTVREEADVAVRVQRAALEELQTELADSVDAAAEAERKATLLAQARALADQRNKPNTVTGQVGECKGGDVAAYANGRIPLSALCPLWGVSGEYLRADAAYAFNRMSQAFASEYGTPLCVTDSYRPYSEQVQVYARSPDMAAKPGTSNHGWGTAVDFCGGIERFGTGTHQWMKLNAPLFGWFHPAWAEPSGSMPEAWHWEYAG